MMSAEKCALPSRGAKEFAEQRLVEIRLFLEVQGHIALGGGLRRDVPNFPKEPVLLRADNGDAC